MVLESERIMTRPWFPRSIFFPPIDFHGLLHDPGPVNGSWFQLPKSESTIYFSVGFFHCSFQQIIWYRNTNDIWYIVYLRFFIFHIYATYTGRWAWLSALIGEKTPSQLPLLNLPNQRRITKHFRYCSLWIRFSVPPFLTPEILGDTMLMEEILHLFSYETLWKMEYSPYQLVSRPEILWCSRSWLGKRWFMSTVSWNIIWSSGAERFFTMGFFPGLEGTPED